MIKPYKFISRERVQRRIFFNWLADGKVKTKYWWRSKQELDRLINIKGRHQSVGRTYILVYHLAHSTTDIFKP